MLRTPTELEKIYEQATKENRQKIDNLYLSFIHGCRCMISKSKPVIAHHEKVRDCIWGPKGKPAHIYTFPLTEKYHTGEKGIHVVPGWRRKHNIDFEVKLEHYHKKFLELLRGES